MTGKTLETYEVTSNPLNVKPSEQISAKIIMSLTKDQKMYRESMLVVLWNSSFPTYKWIFAPFHSHMKPE